MSVQPSPLRPSLPPEIFIVAGETSGDMQAAHLVRALHRDAPPLDVHGVGGSYMAEAGVRLFLDSSTWGAIGYVEPFLRLPSYLRWLRQVEQEIRRRRPSLLVLVDFPGFNLPLAKRVRSIVPILYYFPPMVSVRRGDRARRVAALRMRLLAVLRREEAAYQAAGANVQFIGHPAVDQVRLQWDEATARAQFELSPTVAVVGLLPGSRIQEIRAHLPVLLAAAALLRQTTPQLEFVLPVPATHLRPLVTQLVSQLGVPVRIVSAVYDAMAVCRVLVVSSGSATLEAAILGIPMVTIYRLPWLSAFIVRRFITTPYVALPNLLADREIVPELLQERMTPQGIADAVNRLLSDPVKWTWVRSELLAVAQDLGEPGAISRAAQEVQR
ncbi:MAG TPA: lipid-A-disaccharide synthase, partial [bacterium]|nr:lipid-A-disaccharide synthase [bacterium]